MRWLRLFTSLKVISHLICKIGKKLYDSRKKLSILSRKLLYKAKFARLQFKWKNFCAIFVRLATFNGYYLKQVVV